MKIHSHYLSICLLLCAHYSCQQTPDTHSTPPSQNETATTTTTISTVTSKSHANTNLNLHLNYASNSSHTHEQTSISTTTTQPTTTYNPSHYAWLDQAEESHALINRISPPNGYQREQNDAHSFAHWLQHLPLKPGKPDVYLYNGTKKGNQNAHYAVINMDVGTRDLQQCADAVMRLRAEYLRDNNQENRIKFNFTSGDVAAYSQWKKGYRPVVSGNKVQWKKQKSYQDSYTNFKQYLIKVFNYAGTFSLSKELKPVANLNDIQAGDVFIQGGFPGHAVIVVDVAKTKDGQAFLLAQSYMPAQEMHILRNPNSQTDSPWYQVNNNQKTIQTPEWTFNAADLKRFE